MHPGRTFLKMPGMENGHFCEQKVIICEWTHYDGVTIHVHQLLSVKTYKYFLYHLLWRVDLYSLCRGPADPGAVHCKSQCKIPSLDNFCSGSSVTQHTKLFIIVRDLWGLFHLKSGDVRVPIFGLPPPEFPNFWGYPPAESQFFSYHPPAESTKWLGLPPTCSFCLPTAIFMYKYG